jgi:hypothetical protein
MMRRLAVFTAAVLMLSLLRAEDPASRSPAFPSAAHSGRGAAAEEAALRVTQLASDDFAVRERAALRLLELDEAALPVLRQGLTSADPEVRRLSADVLSHLQSRIEERQIEDLLAEVGPLPLDRYIEQLASAGEVNRLHWKVLRRRADLAARQAGEITGRPLRVPWLDLTHMEVYRSPPRRFISDACLLLDNESRRLPILERCLLVVNGPVDHLPWLQDSVVLINGDLESCTRVDRCVLVVRGRIGRVTLIKDSVILTTGEITRTGFFENSVLEVAGVGECVGSAGCDFLNLQRIPAERTDGDRCITTERSPLATLRLTPR